MSTSVKRTFMANTQGIGQAPAQRYARIKPVTRKVPNRAICHVLFRTSSLGYREEQTHRTPASIVGRPADQSLHQCWQRQAGPQPSLQHRLLAAISDFPPKMDYKKNFCWERCRNCAFQVRCQIVVSLWPVLRFESDQVHF